MDSIAYEKHMRYDELVDGKIPPYVFRLIKKCGKAINDFDMIREGEKVLIGISGGKDSLLLSLCLSQRLKWLPVKYQLKAVMIEWMETPLQPEQRSVLYRYFDKLEVSFEIISEQQHSDGFKGEFNCYLCSRNRRRILFDMAAKDGIHLIALGHHLDDIVETSLMNLVFRSRLESMNPVQNFFDGKLSVIRPLCLLDEASISRVCANYDIPVVKSSCPFDQVNIRSRLKPIIREFSHMDKHARKHVFDAYGFDCRPARPWLDSEA